MPQSTLDSLATQIGSLSTQTYALGGVIIGVSLAIASIFIIRRLIRRV